MNREIKFRGFNPATNEIVSWEGMQGWAMSGLSSPNIMQYTGLKDKNGKEIYGGDFVRIKIPQNNEDPLITHKYFEVIFNEGMFCLKMEEGNYPLSEYLHQESEIIGNIYENPELLDNK